MAIIPLQSYPPGKAQSRGDVARTLPGAGAKYAMMPLSPLSAAVVLEVIGSGYGVLVLIGLALPVIFWAIWRMKKLK